MKGIRSETEREREGLAPVLPRGWAHSRAEDALKCECPPYSTVLCRNSKQDQALTAALKASVNSPLLRSDQQHVLLALT